MIPVGARHRPIVWRLLQLYLHDLSEIDGGALNERAEFQYRWFDAYWTDPDRAAFLVPVRGEWAGFALIRRSATNEVAEFFVVRKYRRRGVGRRLAVDCFRHFPGRWRIHQLARNAPAAEFWRAVIPVPFTETSNSKGTTQRFEIRPERPPTPSRTRAAAGGATKGRGKK